MNDELDRFLPVHDVNYAQALNEIRRGKKTSHWMWYIFPQLKGLGYSETARYYGINGRAEAEAYLKNSVLCAHLLEICEALLLLKENDAQEIFGSIDAKKLRSSMTLFAEVSPDTDVFLRVLEKFYGGVKDQKTLELLK